MKPMNAQQLDWLQTEAPPRPKPVRRPAPLPASTPHRLWLCLRFEDLAVEVLTHYRPEETSAVWIEKQQHCRIHCASPKARSLGIKADMTRAAAQALCPTLRLEARKETAEQRRQQRLIEVASRYSAWVWPAEAGVLLLEVGSTKNLFGGLEKLIKRLMNDLKACGHRAEHAVAASARAAECLARWAPGSVAENPDQTRQFITRLPSASLTTDLRLQRRLYRSGIRRVADLLRLPRQGVGRRYGPSLLRTLDQALSREAEVVPAATRPIFFAQTVELTEPTIQAEQLLAAAGVLLDELVLTLRTQDAAVDRLWLRIHHARGPASQLPMNMSQATRDRAVFQQQLSLLLGSLQLPEPALALRLRTPPFLGHESQNADWLQKHNETEWSATLDAWRARLGPHGVQGLCTRADHRPERAWQFSAPGTASSTSEGPGTPRPCWLRHEPQPLTDVQRQQLHMESGPERIEQGWWDQADICRDYYVARDANGARLWIYQDRRQQNWWLHGYFD